MTTDANLLFGVIAMQLDFIDSEQFAQGCAFWSTEKSKTLGEILVDRKWLSAEDRQTLEDICQRKLDKNDGDIMQTLSVVADAGSRDLMRTVDNNEVNQTLACMPPNPGFVQVREVDVSTDERSHYTLTRVYGQGGLGRVWLARDKNLNREVALKEIRPDLPVDSAEVQRFVTEAQITGQLDHPNIIPIYELGKEDDSKPPFYTMRFMRGQTLRDAVKEYHRKRKKSAATPLDLQRLLNAFCGMCNALAFAHSKGVIHRDLKPANVMLGAFGEVVVLDWGLAKMIDQPEDETQVFPSIKVSSRDDSKTQMGQALGTPAYMAPEQAQGKLDKIDSRSDIYGLGSTLYNMLTNETPHKGKTTIETLQGIVTGPVPSPREIDSTVPAPLDAICVKAMQKESADRYQSAQDLADDVQRWLVDEPVSAYPEPLAKRLGRWIRRHRTFAISAAATLLIVTVASTIAAVLVNDARIAEKEAKELEQTAKLEAETARDEQRKSKEQATRLLRGSRETVDTMLTQVAEWLANQPGMDRSREILLSEAAADYERIASEQSNDPGLQLESGRALLRLGDVQRRMGKPEDAIQSFAKATDVLNQLSGSSETGADMKLELARARMEMGGVLVSLRKVDEAAESYDSAAEMFTELGKISSVKTDSRRYLAECLMLHARLLKSLGKTTASLELAEKASAEFRLLMDEKSTREFRHGLANARVLRGELLTALGRSDEAKIEFNRAIAFFEGLVAEKRDDPDYFEGRAVAFTHLGSISQTLGDYDAAAESFNNAITDYEILKNEQPHIPNYYQNLVNINLRQAQLLIRQGRNTDAQTMSNLTLQRDMNYLLANFVELPQYLENAAFGTMTLSSSLLNQAEYDQVDSQLQIALTIYERKLLPISEEPRYVRGLGYVQLYLGRIFLGLGEPENAVKPIQTAIAQFNQSAKMSDAEAGDIYSTEGLAWAEYYLGNAYYLIGDQQKATESFERARERWESLPDDAEHQFNLAWLLMNCKIEKVRDARKALTIAKQLSSQVPGNLRFGMLHCGALLRSGDLEGSLKVIESVRGKRDSENSFDLLWMALAHHQSGEADKAKDAFEKAMATEFIKDNKGNSQLRDLVDETRTKLGIAGDSGSDEVGDDGVGADNN